MQYLTEVSLRDLKKGEVFKKTPTANKMNLGYIRVSTNQQTVENQRTEILKYANDKKFMIDDFIEIEISSRKNKSDRKIEETISRLNKDDLLIVSELSRLGRSTVEVLGIIDDLLKKGIEIHFIKQGLIISNDKENITSKVMITLFSLFAELERDLISNRTKEALQHRKGKGQILGRKKDSLSKSKYDSKANEILTLFNKNIPASTIIKIIGFGSAKTLIEWKTKRVEDNKLLNILTFNEKYKEYLASIKN